MKKHDFQPYIFYLASFLFSYGYLLVLINGYYHFTYLELIEIGRKDLVVRLGFYAHAIGYLYYPSIIVPIGIINWLAIKQQNLKGKVIWIYTFTALISIALLFYTNVLCGLIYGPKEKWILGLLLMGVSVPIYWNQSLVKRIKSRYHD